MDNWIIFILGGIIGVGVGSYFTAIAKPQKQWSELNEKEKKMRITLLITSAIIFVLGVLVMLTFQHSWF